MKGGKPVENGYNITQSFAKAYRSGSKPTLPKQSSGKLTAVEKAYADYHKEQGRKGKPDYSSEEFMDFASTYKKQGSPTTRKSKTTSASKTSKRKGLMVASGPDDFKSFLKLPKPEKGSKGYAVHMALRSVARAGGGTDDSVRDALVRNGYPKDKAYSKGVKEVVALAKKHGLRI